MKITSSYSLLLLIAAVSSIEATLAPSPFLENFKVVVDNSSSNHNKRNLSNIQRTSCSKDRDLRKLFGDVDVKELYQNTRKTAASVLDKMTAEARELLEKCQKAAQNYSKAEIGLYTSLACALTFALQGEYKVQTFVGISSVSFKITL
jgi:hypothetical protein